MRVITTACIVVALFACTVTAQESTREEFVEFCKANQGRWIGDITWATDWPGFGKKGEKVTAYWEGVLTEDGNALLGRFFAGSGSGTYLVVFDAGAKQTKGLWVTSGGHVSHDIIYRKDGKFVMSGKGSNPNGDKTDQAQTMTLEENGTKITWRGGGTVGGKKIDDFTDVWRKLSK